MEEEKQKYVIGVDGGGTKTIAALSDLKGKILRMGKAGPSSPRNVGIKKTVAEVSQAIGRVLSKEGEILSTFIGLPAVEEEFKFKKEEIRKELAKHREISQVFRGKIEIGSDQIVAFRSGTNEKKGVLVITGTGSVARGWKEGKEVKVSGWGWLADEGSGFWAGQQGFQAVLKDLDGRGPQTKITKLIFKKWKLKTKEDLIGQIYSKDFIGTVSSISKIIDKAADKKDKVAQSIMQEVGKALGQAAISVIKKLSLQNQKFPLVLVGSMFKSKIALDTFKKQVKKISPRAQFIRPKKEPVIGAVKLAIEQVEKERPEMIKKAAQLIKEGGVIVCPTDTVYGLICDATNKKAVKKLFKIKKRPPKKPIPIFVKDIKMVKKLAYINKKQEKFLKKVWPGKVTVVLKAKKNLPKGILGPENKIGLRIPNYKLVNTLLQKSNRPLSGTSANISGKPGSTKIEEVLRQFKKEKVQPDFVIDVGNLKPSKPSTVVDLTGSKLTILRVGELKKEKLIKHF